MKRLKSVCMLVLLAVILLASSFSAEAARIKLNKKKATQRCNTAMTVLHLKGANKGKIIWKTSNKKVATCDSNGSNHCIVVSHKAGKAKITAKYKGKTYTCKVTVKDKPAITPSKVSLKVGASAYINVWGTAKKVKWSVANKSIVRLRKKKKYTYIVKGLKAGKTKVRAKVGKKTLTCTITVTEKKTSSVDKQTSTVEDITSPTEEEMSPMAKAYNSILNSEKPYAFGVEDIDVDGFPELMAVHIDDSRAAIKFYWWDGNAAKPVGDITVDRTAWKHFLICYGPGILTVSRGQTYHFNESGVNYTLANGILTELDSTELNLNACYTLLDSGFLDLSIYDIDHILVVDTPENRKAKLK